MAEPNPDARTNQQFIQSIKEKYNSARNALNGQNKPSESLANPSLRNQASHTPVKYALINAEHLIVIHLKLVLTAASSLRTMTLSAGNTRTAPTDQRSMMHQK